MQVIHAALVDVVSAGRADTAKLLWCMGQLGVSPVRPADDLPVLMDIDGDFPQLWSSLLEDSLGMS